MLTSGLLLLRQNFQLKKDVFYFHVFLYLSYKQRLQALIPTEEELSLIKEAKAQNPHASLAQAELCLLTLGEIPYLSTRFQLWAFALDYDSLERVGGSTVTHYT